MAKYNCTNVEDVFLLLSRKQKEGSVATGEIGASDIEMDEVEQRQKKDQRNPEFVSYGVLKFRSHFEFERDPFIVPQFSLPLIILIAACMAYLLERWLNYIMYYMYDYYYYYS